MKDCCDWMLNPYLQLDPESDGTIGDRPVCLLPDKATTKVLQLGVRSRGRDTDAFSQDWSKARGFANPPPWCLITHSLSQVKQQKAKLVMVTPLWIMQPWYPTILGMLEDYPLLLPMSPDLVILLTAQDDFIIK